MTTCNRLKPPATLRQAVHIIAGDLSVQKDNQTICESIDKQQGRLDIAILNAGTCEYVEIDEFDSAMFKRLMDINFMGMVYGIEASLPLLKQSQSAQLIGMSSTAAYLGFPRSEAYGASKAAIYNMFKALRRQFEAAQYRQQCDLSRVLSPQN
jgi:NADP-dependent 3-hydroxy acid dehydrogenase YdfG